jgi:hypothetical protein
MVGEFEGLPHVPQPPENTGGQCDRGADNDADYFEHGLAIELNELALAYDVQCPLRMA